MAKEEPGAITRRRGSRTAPIRIDCLNIMMTFLKHRRSLRLSGYDYSKVGAYFITICVKDRKCLLGSILNDRMQLNSHGLIAAYSWNWLSQAYDHVELDEYVIMPNHLHGIIIITNCRGGSREPPLHVSAR